MKIEELKKITQKLKDTKDENYNKISMYYNKYRIVSENQKDYQLMKTLTFSTFPFFVMIITLMLNDTLTINLLNTIPPLTLPIITIAGSLTIGSTINKILNKKSKIKEKFKNFSKSKTEIEKLEEELNYKIKLEKLKNRNIIIEDILDNIESKITILENISSNIDKDEIKTEEELRITINELSKILNEKYNKLDILTTQKVLSNRFYKIRQKGQKILDIPMIVMLSGLIATVFTTLPFIVTHTEEYIPFFKKEILLISSLTIGPVIGVTYYLKKNSNENKVFNKINKTLGNNALSEKENNLYSEKAQIKKVINQLLSEIITTKIMLIEHKQALEKVLQKNNLNTLEEKQEKLWDDILLKEDEIKVAIQESPTPFNPQTIFNSGDEDKLEQDTLSKKQKAPMLVKKLIPPKK